MVTEALWVRLEAKPGKEMEVESFLRAGLSVVEEEPATTAWFALRLDQTPSVSSTPQRRGPRDAPLVPLRPGKR
jgi:hypothetical protein